MSNKTKSKKKNQKQLLICVIIVLLIIGLVCFWVSMINNNKEGLRLNNLYEMLKEKESYSFTTTLDDDNKMYYAELENNKAYINTFYERTESEFIIRDGNTYLIMDDVKTYYTYRNNESDLNKIENVLLGLKDLEHQKGKEKIKNKTYKYEEYNVLTPFAFLDTSNIGEDEEVKTRFYFKENELVYIKTITSQKEELLKVEISNNVNKKIFEIPSEYKEM